MSGKHFLSLNPPCKPECTAGITSHVPFSSLINLIWYFLYFIWKCLICLFDIIVTLLLSVDFTLSLQYLLRNVLNRFAMPCDILDIHFDIVWDAWYFIRHYFWHLIWYLVWEHFWHLHCLFDTGIAHCNLQLGVGVWGNSDQNLTTHLAGKKLCFFGFRLYRLQLICGWGCCKDPYLSTSNMECNKVCLLLPWDAGNS